MPKMLFSSDQKNREALRQTQEEIARQRNKLQIIQLKLKECFHDDGSITRNGLNLELDDLDECRRSEDMDPTDGTAQTLIQGQQNEVQKLLKMRKKLLDEQSALRDSLAEMEKEAADLASKLNRRKADAGS